MSRKDHDRMIRTLRQFGLRYPGAHLKSPWPGHEDLAVRDKTFCYLPPEGQRCTAARPPPPIDEESGALTSALAVKTRDARRAPRAGSPLPEWGRWR